LPNIRPEHKKGALMPMPYPDTRTEDLVRRCCTGRPLLTPIAGWKTSIREIRAWIEAQNKLTFSILESSPLRTQNPGAHDRTVGLREIFPAG
jgi:hypothetical protein